MTESILEYPDNLVLHLERDRRSYKIFTTDRKGLYKSINGLWSGDSVIDTKFIDEREVKQLLVDSAINGYEIKLNLIFKEGLHNLAKALSKEYKEHLEKKNEEEVV